MPPRLEPVVDLSRPPSRRCRRCRPSSTAGGLGQIGDVIHNFSAAVSGREAEIRELLTRLDDFVGTLDAQRDNIIESIKQLNRVAGTFAESTRRDRPGAQGDSARDRRADQGTAAADHRADEARHLQRHRYPSWSTTAGDDLVKNLQNLEPALKSLADIGPDLEPGAASSRRPSPTARASRTRSSEGDYINLFATFDLTYPATEAHDAPRDALGRRGRQAHPGAGRSLLPELHLRPDHGRRCAAADQALRPHAEAAPGQPMPPMIGPVLPMVPPPPARPRFGLRRCCSSRRSSRARTLPRLRSPQPSAPAPGAPPRS